MAASITPNASACRREPTLDDDSVPGAGEAGVDSQDDHVFAYSTWRVGRLPRSSLAPPNGRRLPTLISDTKPSDCCVMSTAHASHCIPGPDHPIDVEPFDGRVRVTYADYTVADTIERAELREAAYPPARITCRWQMSTTVRCGRAIRRATVSVQGRRVLLRRDRSPHASGGRRRRRVATLPHPASGSVSRDHGVRRLLIPTRWMVEAPATAG